MKELIKWIKEERKKYLIRKAKKIFRIEAYDDGSYWLTVNGWRILHNEDLSVNPFKVLLNARARYVTDTLGGEPNDMDNLYFFDNINNNNNGKD